MILLRQRLFTSKEDKDKDKDTYPLFTKKYWKNLTNGTESQKQLFSWRLRQQNKILGKDTVLGKANRGRLNRRYRDSISMSSYRDEHWGDPDFLI